MKNKPLHLILDDLKDKYDLNFSELGKAFIGSVLSIPASYFVSRIHYANSNVKTKIKREFITSLKKNLCDEKTIDKYKGFSKDNFLALFQYRKIRDDENSIEGILNKIISDDKVKTEDVTLFEGIYHAVYEGSKNYESLDRVKKRGSGSLKNLEYDAVMEKLKEYYSN
ncbi:MAG: hypothetical protein PWP03_723 [Candidatus Woesearchaeota archaeon]|nr:hypothetical protein [Candidatus Woesearchaeota archaeon]MDN5328085.1 hypothetical protein [Candidatus Woesearchaeota archaeon]